MLRDPGVAEDVRGLHPFVLLDGTVHAKLGIGDEAGARRTLEVLRPLVRRVRGDLQVRLLEARLGR